MLAATGILAVGIGVFVFERNRGLPIERDARTILAEIEQGDGGGLYAHGYVHEKEALGLTPEKVEAVYRQLILPRFKAFHPVGPILSMVNRDASQAVAWQRMSDDHGHEFDLDASPWSTPDGGKQMLMARLETAWIVDNRLVRGRSTDQLGCVEARLEGLAQDRRTLETIGVPGMVTDDPRDPMQPWPDYQRAWAKVATRLRETPTKN